MILLKIVGLALFTAFCFAVGQGTNGFAAVAAPCFFVGLIVLYACPGLIAFQRGHVNLMSIAAINLFLGWTLLGWVAALAWALTAKEVSKPTLDPSEVPGLPGWGGSAR